MSDKQRYVCVLSDNGDLGVRSERLSRQENADDKDSPSGHCPPMHSRGPRKDRFLELLPL